MYFDVNNFETEFNNAKDPSFWSDFFDDIGNSFNYYADMITPEFFKKPWTQADVDAYNAALMWFLIGYYVALFIILMIL